MRIKENSVLCRRLAIFPLPTSPNSLDICRREKDPESYTISKEFMPCVSVEYIYPFDQEAEAKQWKEYGFITELVLNL